MSDYCEHGMLRRKCQPCDDAADIKKLEAEVARLRDEAKAREFTVEMISSQREATVERARQVEAEVSRFREALGLLTTLHPTMEMDASDPLEMAQKIEAHVRAALARERRLIELLAKARPMVMASISAQYTFIKEALEAIDKNETLREIDAALADGPERVRLLCPKCAAVVGYTADGPEEGKEGRDA